MKKKKIVACILSLLFIFSLIIIVVSSKKKEIISPKPQNEITEINNASSEADNTENNNVYSEPDNTEDYTQESFQESPEPVTDSKSEQSSKEYENYRLATDTDKSRYEITNLKKTSDSKKTTIIGKIKNNGGSENIVLKAEFTGKVKSSSSIEIKNLKVGNSQNFEIKILNNAATNDYKVYVEYVGE